MNLYNCMCIYAICSVFQKAYPTRIKGLNCYRMPLMFEALLKFCKTLLSDKLSNRASKSWISMALPHANITNLHISFRLVEFICHQQPISHRKHILKVSNQVIQKPAFLVSYSYRDYLEDLYIVGASYYMTLSYKQRMNALIRLRGCADWSSHLLFANHRHIIFRFIANLATEIAPKTHTKQ